METSLSSGERGDRAHNIGLRVLPILVDAGEPALQLDHEGWPDVKQGMVLHGRHSGTTYKVLDSQSLGSGHFGRVWAVEKTSTGQPKSLCGLKVFRHRGPLSYVCAPTDMQGKDPNSHVDLDVRSVYEQEVRCMWTAKGVPRTCGLVEHYEDPRTGPFIVTWPVCKISLEKALSDKEAAPPYDYAMAVKYAFQLTTALAHLHHRSISHDDITLRNVLIEDATGIRLIDFGISGDARPFRRKCDFGKAYSASLAPEVNDESVPDDAIIDAKIADLYGLGTCLYAVLTLDRARQCYPDMPESEVREAIASTWKDSKIDGDMAMIVAGFLRRQPRDRLVIDSILETLEFLVETRQARLPSSNYRRLDCMYYVVICLFCLLFIPSLQNWAGILACLSAMVATIVTRRMGGCDLSSPHARRSIITAGFYYFPAELFLIGPPLTNYTPEEWSTLFSVWEWVDYSIFMAAGLVLWVTLLVIRLRGHNVTTGANEVMRRLSNSRRDILVLGIIYSYLPYEWWPTLIASLALLINMHKAYQCMPLIRRAA